MLSIPVSPGSSGVREKISGLTVQSILLVGGFGESPYLQRRLRETFEESGLLHVVTVNEPAKKTVAEGGSLFYAKENVLTRCTEVAHGLHVKFPYAECKDKCGNRRPFRDLQDLQAVKGGWLSIVPKGASIHNHSIYRVDCSRTFGDDQEYTYTRDLLVIAYYGGAGSPAEPTWSRDRRDRYLPGFRECCTITADLTELAKATPSRTNSNGESYKLLKYDVCILPGGVSLRV